MSEQEQAEQSLINWASVREDRDNRIRRALAAGISKHRIHQLTGVSRTTIDRLLKEAE